MIKGRCGVTIVELIMVIVVVGILAGGLSLGIIETINLWSFLSFNNEIASQGRIALMRMGREIRQMAVRDSIFEPIQTAESSRLIFTAMDLDEDDSDDLLEFYLNGNDLRRVFNNNPSGPPRGDILATYVSNLTFTYYAEDNSQLATPVTDPSQVNRIGVALTLSNSSGSRTLNLNSQIFPRNLAQ